MIQRIEDIVSWLPSEWPALVAQLKNFRDGLVDQINSKLDSAYQYFFNSTDWYGYMTPPDPLVAFILTRTGLNSERDVAAQAQPAAG